MTLSTATSLLVPTYNLKYIKNYMMRQVVLLIMMFMSQFSWGQKLAGKVVDAKSNAIEFANVALYDKDSTFLAGVVTDSCGVFAMNYSEGKACFFKVSCVGYSTKTVAVSNEKFYSITLQQDNVMLKDVIVKGHLPKYTRVPGGYSVAVKNSILEKLFSANDILSSLPHISGSNGNFLVFGKGSPEIYINNRKLRDKSELAHLKPSDIEKVILLTNPGVKYDSEVKSVIIIKTKKPQGEGLSGSVDGVYGQKDKASYNSNINLNWRSSKFDLFGSLGHSNNYDSRKQEISQTVHGFKHEINEKMSDMHQSMRTKNILGTIGADYLLNDSNSIGVSYRISKSLQSQHMHSAYSDSLFVDSKLQDNINYRMNAVPSSGPAHEVDAYYNGKIHNFKITFDNYYQTKNASSTISGTLVNKNYINDSDIIYGKKTDNDFDIVVDKSTLNKLFTGEEKIGIQTGYSVQDLIGYKVNCGDLIFTITGITDIGDYSIFTNKKYMIDILYNSLGTDETMVYDAETSDKYLNYKLIDNLSIKKGRLPENDYEVVININKEIDNPLNSKLENKINNKKLTVVGYYDGKNMLVNENMIKYELISKSKNLTIMPSDSEIAIESLNNENLNVVKSYDSAKEKYLDSRETVVKSGLIASGVILFISFVEIYLMIRSSYLSRIKEIGIYRAIGTKKSDIYKMFYGEIIAITTVASLPGILFTTYALKTLQTISYFEKNYLVNPFTIILSILIVYLFNIIVGLLPIMKIVSKTPASILARKDVD